MENIKYSFIGHQERCFDLKYSSDSSILLSSSEDGTAKIWNVETKQIIETLTHNQQSEVLRSSFVSDGIICTCGSDGNALIWKQNNSNTSYQKILSLTHQDQIYACVTSECIADPHVITASDNMMHIWDLSNYSNDSSYSISFDSISSLLDADVEGAFGGPRNPDNKAFIFDVQPAATSHVSQGHEGNPLWTTIALAMSDGTIRLVDLRNMSEAHTFLVTPQNSSGVHVHATGVSWTPDKLSLVASSGSGDVILFDIRMGTTRGVVIGAHDSSCFGTCFKPNSQSLHFASWSSDGAVRLWDANVLDGLCDRSSNLREIILPDYPIYCSAADSKKESNELVIGGGSSKKSFMGPLIHVVNIWSV